jgi:2-phosphosulfolactate phosphatase
MEIRVGSLISGATDAVGTTVIIDVFRAFTTAAVALSQGARRIVMVDTLEKALALRSSGTGDYCIGERDSVKPPGFDFGNSPAELARADVVGKTLVQTTSNGTAGINAAQGADHLRRRLRDGGSDPASDPAPQTSRRHPRRHRPQ